MDALDQVIVESRCTQLCYGFAHLLDTGDFDAMISLFADDGVFDRVGQLLHGHDEMRAAFRARPTGITTRHLVTNVHFLDVQPDHAEAHVYNLSYHALGDDTTNGPLVYGTANGRFIDFHDHYRLTDGGWRFASRLARVIFVPDDWKEESLATH